MKVSTIVSWSMQCWMDDHGAVHFCFCIFALNPYPVFSPRHHCALFCHNSVKPEEWWTLMLGNWRQWNNDTQAGTRSGVNFPPSAAWLQCDWCECSLAVNLVHFHPVLGVRVLTGSSISGVWHWWHGLHQAPACTWYESYLVLGLVLPYNLSIEHRHSPQSGRQMVLSLSGVIIFLHLGWSSLF